MLPAEPSAVDPAEIAGAARARTTVLSRIADACTRSGRDPAAIHLVAVSKTVSAERVRAAAAAGLEVFGENRVQEAEAKRPLVGTGSWHLIGPLQGNKARRAVETFDVIESVDSLDLARRLDRIVRELRDLPAAGDVPTERRFPILVQVNVDDDPGKAGFTPASLADALPELIGLGALRVDGCMTIGRLVEDPDDARPTFRRLRALAADLRSREPALGPQLSMGMTDDYPVAVEEGATIVRVGRALFGERGA
ncbi:MAG: YggS family pyridoxal phosphate-dependent enzyme [Candidatus Limnocylindrales bacterium]